MKKKQCIRGLAAICLALVLTTSIFAGTDATVRSYEQQMAALVAKQEEALAKLDQVRGDYSNVMETKAYYDEVVTLTEKKKLLAQAQLETLEAQIVEKQDAIARAEEDLARKEAASLARMAEMYEEGELSSLEMLLGAESLRDFLTRLEWVLDIRSHDTAVMNELTETKETLALRLAELESALAVRQSTMETLEADILLAAETAEEARVYMEELKQNEAALLQNYYANKAAEEALDKELTAYLAELQAKQNAAYVGGELGWPLPLDVYYRVSSEYGNRMLWGEPNFHLGIDLACASGTEIYAANGGKVVTSVVDHWSYGNYVVIDHGGGMATLYAHMSSQTVWAGDTVEKGQCIGYVGMTGQTDGYHLHYEVRKNGATTNPRDYLVLP